MVSSVLDVYNAALSAAHAKGRLSSLSQESPELYECNLWYETVAKTVQEAAYWPSCRYVNYLSLQSERTTSAAWALGDPMPEYKYKYDVPDNYLRAWYLTNFDRFDLSFDIAENNVVINTNVDDAALVYARYQNNPAHWTPSQTLATIYGLAAHICGQLTGQGSIVQKNVRMANDLLLQAQAVSRSHPENQVKVLPPALAARGYDDVHYDSVRYYYPFGGLFSLGETGA